MTGASAVVPDTGSARLPGLRTVLGRWAGICAAALVGLGGGWAFGTVQGPSYESTQYVTVSSATEPDAGLAARAAQGLARLGATVSLVQQPLAEAGLDWSAAEIRAHVTVQAAPDAPLISITGIGDTPAQAQTVAEVVGATLADVDDLGPFQASVAAQAPLPQEPAVPTWVAPAGGLALGLAAGVVAAVVVPERPRLPAGARTGRRRWAQLRRRSR